MREEINQDLMRQLPCVATNTLVNMRALALATMLITAAATAQNLVPNGSFESYSSCPTSDAQVTYATGWVDYLFSPDFWHACGTPGVAGVPNNIYSYQEARTGSGFGGFHAFTAQGLSADGFREFMGVQLTGPLIIGQEYHVEMYVSWSTSGAGTQGSMRYANNKLGAFFSTQSRSGLLGWYPLPNYSHIYSNDVITDSLGWTLIEGSFIADSAYAYAYFGNFFGDLETDDTLINPGGQWGLSYYYVEDICVTPVGGDCLFTAVPDEADAMDKGVRIYPNPFGSHLMVEGVRPGAVMELYDQLGRSVLQMVTLPSTSATMVGLPALPSGMYMMVIQQENGELHRKLLLHR